MSVAPISAVEKRLRALHTVGVVCGLAAGAWLGTAEAPVKLASGQIPPFVVTLGMVLGVFLARWTVPVMLKGAGFVMRDLRQNAHLIVWALIAGTLWVVANTLTVFAIKNVGLSIAFPLWNMNSLVGLFWGWLLFHELRGARPREWMKVVGGAAIILIGATVLAYATTHQASHSARAWFGVLAALGAGVLWGTQYIAYRKAYISGINPLSFVTVVAFGELIATISLGVYFHNGFGNLFGQISLARPILLWLFLGGFCWVFGDLFQQYAAKYIGIGRGIPLSNTNQLWGIAWGALVFGEFVQMPPSARAWVIAGSVMMIFGAAAISTASASGSEMKSWNAAMERECSRYDLDRQKVARSQTAENALDPHPRSHKRWELLALIGVCVLFTALVFNARRPEIAFTASWAMALTCATVSFLLVGGVLLWRRTRFC